MESEDACLAHQTLPEALSVEKIPEARRPQSEDWKFVQGGMPEVVFVRPGVFNVVHRYINSKDPSGTGVIVPTLVSVLEAWRNKTVDTIINGKRITFPTALLWQFHGKPCESKSRTKYNRIPVSPNHTGG